MSIPKQDERAPGQTVLVMGATIYVLSERNTNQWCAHVQGPPRAEAEAIAEQIAQACNAYGSTDALRSALAEAQERTRKAENALFQFNYPPDPKMLREVADEIDCGQTCEFGNIEWDTGAHNCSKRDREGCPGDNAIQLREFADAIEAAGSKPTPEPSLDECDELAQTLLGGSEPLMRPLSVRSHPHETRAALSGSPAPSTGPSAFQLADMIPEWMAVRLLNGERAIEASEFRQRDEIIAFGLARRAWPSETGDTWQTWLTPLGLEVRDLLAKRYVARTALAGVTAPSEVAK